jgi:hypothetical protein
MGRGEHHGNLKASSTLPCWFPHVLLFQPYSRYCVLVRCELCERETGNEEGRLGKIIVAVLHMLN